MFGKSRHRAGARRWLGRILVPVVAVSAFTMITAGSALAQGGGSTSKPSGCSTRWSTSPYGAQAYARAGIFWDNVNVTTINVVAGWSLVEDMIDCGPGGYTVTAYKINVVTLIRVDGFGLNCNIGSAGGTCASTGTAVTYTQKTNCTNASSCGLSLGYMQFIAPPGGYLTSVRLQTQVKLNKKGGTNPLTWTTAWI
ncbi:hypothetical protein [Rhizocola hellebori]|nr:hypothetical protein [Rhizocola hellebori]